MLTPPQKHVNCSSALYLGADKIELVDNVKTLGVIFNNHLNWDAHVERIASKLARACGVICRLRYMLPTKIKLMLYNSLFLSHVSYCNLVWGTTSKTNIHSLQTLQKKTIRHIVTAPFNAHTNEIFRTLNVLPIEHFYEYNLVLKIKKYFRCNNAIFLNLCNLVVSQEPLYEFRKRNHWVLPFSRTNYGSCRLQYQVPWVLNVLYSSKTELSTLTKKALKSNLLNKGTII